MSYPLYRGKLPARVGLRVGRPLKDSLSSLGPQRVPFPSRVFPENTGALSSAQNMGTEETHLGIPGII